MGLNYVAVGWNRQKRIYDTVMLAGVLLYLGLFLGIGFVLRGAHCVSADHWLSVSL